MIRNTQIEPVDTERMVQARTDRGLSLSDMKKAAGVDRHLWSRWESGMHAPTARHIHTICKAIGITPNELMGWDG